jgi:Holliday junction DNA helicase RuvA
MILTLTGKLSHKLNDSLIIDVSGIGYQVFVPQPTLIASTKNQTLSLWIHDHIREDARDLFGFSSESEFRLFRSLINVSGIGPKTALAMLAADAKEVERRIDAGDVDWLTGVPGVGKKTAQKIVLELKGKLVDPKAEDELTGALVSMGYHRDEAVRASSQAKGDTFEQRLKQSLKVLAR